MTPTQILEAVALVLKWGQFVASVGGDAMPFVAIALKWSSGEAQPTHLDFVELAAAGKPFLDKLNDTSKDRR